FKCDWSSDVCSSDLSQPSPDKTAMDELKRLNDEGAKAYGKGDFPTALKAWQTGLDKAQAIKNEKRIADFLINIGSVYDSLGQYEDRKSTRLNSSHT